MERNEVHNGSSQLNWTDNRMQGRGRRVGTCLEAGDQGRDEDVEWEARSGFVEDAGRWCWIRRSLPELAVREPQD